MLFQALCLSLIGIFTYQARTPTKDNPIIVKYDYFHLKDNRPKSGFERDPKTGRYRFYTDNWATHIEIIAVAKEFKQPVVLEFDGIVERAEYPLRLVVGDVSYPLTPKEYDRELFHIEHKNRRTTVEFLNKGQALLKPGAVFHYQQISW